jgi:hypothetical protein
LAGFNAPGCNATPTATWRVSNNRVVVRWAGGELSGSIEKDGRFEASRFVLLRLTRLYGRIEGEKLTAEIDDPYCKYRFELTKE